MVPLARLERALPKESDFESLASTNSTTGAPDEMHVNDSRCASLASPPGGIKAGYRMTLMPGYWPYIDFVTRCGNAST